MSRRQNNLPERWLIVDAAFEDAVADLRRLPARSGVLVLGKIKPADERRFRQLGRSRRATIVAEERGTAARVHNVRELRQALLRRTPLILLSPLYPTASHPDWPPLPRMRAAAMSRLGGRGLLALGGMNPRRFAQVKALGFRGWAGISAFRT